MVAFQELRSRLQTGTSALCVCVLKLTILYYLGLVALTKSGFDDTKVLDKMKAEGWYEDAITLLIGDHGYQLGESNQ